MKILQVARRLFQRQTQRLQSLARQVKKNFLNFARDVQLRREAPFDLVTHERTGSPTEMRALIFGASLHLHQRPAMRLEPAEFELGHMDCMAFAHRSGANAVFNRSCTPKEPRLRGARWVGSPSGQH